MKELNHLIVAFDGNEDSREALELGISMSKKLNSQLSVVYISKENPVSPLTDTDRSPLFSPVHAYPVGEMRNYPATPVLPEQQEEVNPDSSHDYPNKSHEDIAMESEANRILQHHHMKADIAVSYGEPSDAIVSYAEENNGDLIIVGNRNISGLKKLIFGSVSEKVSQLSTIPVLIAK
ncbi:universal stress protein [Metabacillus schmidteae]|uniref:universal stress protein n=1 Tax=Metabacillus schmidteae TaxID=2730405 RepID=UPI00158AEFBF|nr:universal stress protein [Metabacillus schmidteae]